MESGEYANNHGMVGHYPLTIEKRAREAYFHSLIYYIPFVRFLRTLPEVGNASVRWAEVKKRKLETLRRGFTELFHSETTMTTS